MRNSNGQKARKVLGSEYAPVDIPAPRQLQTFAVLFWLLFFFVIPIISYPIIIYLLCFSSFEIFKRTAAFLLPYLWWIWVVDRSSCNTGGRPITWVRNWFIWKWYSDYFPINIVKTAELNPKINYLFGSHPHGRLCSGAFNSFATGARHMEKIFPGFSFHLLTRELNFRWPMVRDLILSLGMCAANDDGMKHLLNSRGGGRAVVFIPEGVPGPLNYQPGSYVVQLKENKGFIKLALQNGIELVPCFTFGEAEVCPKNSKSPKWILIQKTAQSINQIIAPVTFWGLGLFKNSVGLLPKRRPVTVVVGAPVHVEIVEKPSQQEIDKLHQIYVDALVELFYSHRDMYAADNNHELVII